VKRNKNDKLIIHYTTFKINQTVKFVKLFEKMFNVSSVVPDNSLKTFFHSLMLLLLKFWKFVPLNQQNEFSWSNSVFQIGVAGKPSSTTALINENNASRLLSRAMELIFSNNLTNFTV